MNRVHPLLNLERNQVTELSEFASTVKHQMPFELTSS